MLCLRNILLIYLANYVICVRRPENNRNRGPGRNKENKFIPVVEWNVMEFEFPCEEDRNRAIQSKDYIYGNAVPMDCDAYYAPGRQVTIFVALPRIVCGIPVTMGTVTEDRKIAPYPDYSWHVNNGNNCNGLYSVHRVAIDACNRLWVLDSGKLGCCEQVCTPKLIAFDLVNNNREVYRHQFCANTYNCRSQFVNLVIDVREGDCSNAFMYVADAFAFTLVVVDMLNDRSWRVEQQTFYPCVPYGTLCIAGECIELMAGVFGMALGPPSYTNNNNCPRSQFNHLYFHSLASIKENIIATSILRNYSFINNPQAGINDVTVLRGSRPSQSIAEAIDKDGIQYFGLMNPPSIWCWNTGVEFERFNFDLLALDQRKLQYLISIKLVIAADGRQELWIISNRLQKHILNSYDRNETNFRIYRQCTSVLLENSICQSYGVS